MGNPCGEGRPVDGRQGPVFTDAVGRDIAAEIIYHVDELGPQRWGQHRHKANNKSCPYV